MKVIILAAGYGTRLQRDIAQDSSGNFSHLRGLPKPLITIGTKPLLSHWMQSLTDAGLNKETFVITNDLYKATFEAWSREWSHVTLISDGTSSNEDRTGAVACIRLAVQQGRIDDDILVIGGDTLFYDDFSLSAVLEAYDRRKESVPEASLVLSNHIPDEETVKRGILEVDADEKVVGFLEKPNPEETSSRRACPCFYLFSRQSLHELDSFFKEDRPMKEKDATGNFIKYLHTRMPVYVYDISGRFDVGSLADYLLCHKHFLEKEQSSRDE